MQLNQIKQITLNRYGYPRDPCCVSYNASQNLVAIGCHNGSIYLIHDEFNKIYINIEEGFISQIVFLKYSPHLIIISNSNSIYFVNFLKNETKNKIQLKNEKISATFLSTSDDILFVGTTKGNVYLVQIENDSFILTKYAIFWNQSCRGNAHLHPGGVIFLQTCAQNIFLYIVFSNGILVKWSLSEKGSEKIVNLCEKLFSCGMINDNTIALGCSDSSIIIYELQNWSFSRKRISNDFTRIGIVWKILTTFSEGLTGNSEMFLCCGGLGELDSDGAGLCLFKNDEQIILSTDPVIGAIFYTNQNNVCVLSLIQDRLLAYIFNSNNEFTVCDNYFHFNYSKIDVKFFYSIDFQILPIEIVKNLSKATSKCHDNFNYELEEFADCAILLIVGCEHGLIKVFVTNLYGFFCISEFNLPCKQDPNNIKYVLDKNVVVIHCGACLYILKLSISDKNDTISIITINSDKTFTQTRAINPILASSENNSILMLQCIIKFPSNVENLCFDLFSLDKFYFYYEDIFYFIDNQWNIQADFLLKSLINEFCKKKKMFAKTKQILTSKNKISEFKNYSKDIFITCTSFHKFNHENGVLNTIFCHFNNESIISIMFEADLKIQVIENLCKIKARVFDMVVFQPNHSDDKLIDSSINKTEDKLIIILATSIMIYQIFNFNILSTIETSINIPTFLNFYRIINNDIFIVDNNQIIFCYSLTDYTAKYHMSILPNNHYFIQFVQDKNNIQLICSNLNDLAWVSINQNDSSEKHFSKFINYDCSFDLSSALSYYNPLRLIYNFFQNKPSLKNISDIVSSSKDIITSSVANSFSNDNLKSEILILANARSEKLSKVGEEAEELKNAASGLNKKANLILEKMKKGH